MSRDLKGQAESKNRSGAPFGKAADNSRQDAADVGIYGARRPLSLRERLDQNEALQKARMQKDAGSGSLSAYAGSTKSKIADAGARQQGQLQGEALPPAYAPQERPRAAPLRAYGAPQPTPPQLRQPQLTQPQAADGNGQQPTLELRQQMPFPAQLPTQPTQQQPYSPAKLARQAVPGAIHAQVGPTARLAANYPPVDPQQAPIGVDSPSPASQRQTAQPILRAQPAFPAGSGSDADADAAAGRLADILESEAALYGDVAAISAKKTEIIVKGKIEELNSLVKAEQAMILKIGKLEAERESAINSLSEKLGLNLDGLTLSQITSRLSDKTYKRLDECQGTLMGTLVGIKSANEVNSQLIQNALDYINFSVNLITSDQASGSLYSEEGQEDVSGARRNVFDVKL
jgi:hypothetical protein